MSLDIERKELPTTVSVFAERVFKTYIRVDTNYIGGDLGIAREKVLKEILSE